MLRLRHTKRSDDRMMCESRQIVVSCEYRQKEMNCECRLREMKRGRITRAGRIGLLLFVLLCICPGICSGRHASARRLSTDVKKAASGCVIMGIEGSFKESRDSYVMRVNEIRREACEKGYPDPRNTSRLLTAEDYVPVQWSSDLQYIARIRAAEAAVYQSHERPNGKSGTELVSPDRVTASDEVLAWSEEGISHWYRGKSAWLNHESGQSSTAYAKLINPDYKYIAISHFASRYGMKTDCYVGEFSDLSYLDSSEMEREFDVIQKLEVRQENVWNYNIFSSDNSFVMDRRKKKKLSVKASVIYQGECYLDYLGKVEWNSSRPGKLRVNKYGVVRGRKYGRATIRAMFDDITLYENIKIFPHFEAVYLKHIHAVNKKAVVKWKKGNRSITGYQLQISKKRRMKKSGRFITVRGRRRTQKTIRKLKKKKVYYIRIRSYKKYGGKKYFSPWSPRARVRIR